MGCSSETIFPQFGGAIATDSTCVRSQYVLRESRERLESQVRKLRLAFQNRLSSTNPEREIVESHAAGLTLFFTVGSGQNGKFETVVWLFRS
jgi:hypothetical protein